MEDIKPTAPSPTGPPVRDITAPLPAPEGAHFEEHADPTESPAPAANEVQPAPAAEPEEQPTPEAEDEAPAPVEQAKPKVPKQHGSGFAIFAAILIVLGLGAMFTYAYLQTQ